MKFVRPLYRELFAWEEQKAVAVETFQEWRSNYHPIAAKMLAQDLKLA
jgi:leukotriene-A4 hydrolase